MRIMGNDAFKALRAAVRDLFLVICRELGIDRLADWLAMKLEGKRNDQ
jgi:hypothetical protein